MYLIYQQVLQSIVTVPAADCPVIKLIKAYCEKGHRAALTGQESSDHPASVDQSAGQSFPALQRAQHRGCWVQCWMAWLGYLESITYKLVA